MNVLEENNKANMATQGTTTAFFTAYLHTAYVAMLPWLLVAVPLILLDLKYGRKKAQLKYERTLSDKDKVTLNKSIRMTIDKVFSYICWIMLSITLSIAFEQNLIKYVLMGVIYGLEVWSLFRSYVFIKFGVELSDKSMLRLLLRMIWSKLTGMNDDFNDIIKDSNEKSK